jgi:hypothetical protein
LGTDTGLGAFGADQERDRGDQREGDGINGGYGAAGVVAVEAGAGVKIKLGLCPGAETMVVARIVLLPLTRGTTNKTFARSQGQQALIALTACARKTGGIDAASSLAG